jgi:hypothetical protein
MKSHLAFINCEEQSTRALPEVQEIFEVISSVPWSASQVSATAKTGREIEWQEAYNRLFELEFEAHHWETQPTILTSPLHKADFAKNKVFVEVQFGTSPTVYRDFYKFHLGSVNEVLDLGVLIVPTNQYRFFPERNPESVRNMATFEYALEHLSALPIPVPILLVGLQPEN